MEKGLPPIIVSVDEFRTGKFEEDRTVLLHYTEDEFKRIVTEFKPSLMPAPGPGLYLIPLPGRGGHLGIAFCGPGEVPVIGRDGSVRCIPSEFEDTTDLQEPAEGEGGQPDCRVQLDEFGMPHCVGRCEEGGSCQRHVSFSGHGYLISCFCRIRMERVRPSISSR